MTGSNVSLPVEPPPPPSPPQLVWYAATNGSAAGAGTAASPVDLATAAQRQSDATTVILADGVYSWPASAIAPLKLYGIWQADTGARFGAFVVIP